MNPGDARSNYLISGSPAYGSDRNIFVTLAAMNAQRNTYVNGAGPDILGSFNSQVPWWLGVNGSTPADQIDFVSVIRILRLF